jgi:PAS domain-containing protein
LLCCRTFCFTAISALANEVNQNLLEKHFVTGAFVDETHTLFQGLFEVSPDALVVINTEGRIVLVNRQAEKAFGYARAELIGQSIECLVPERLRGQSMRRTAR